VGVAQGIVRTYDGVGCITRGDAALVLYKSPARLERTRWLFDSIDALAATKPDGVIAFLVVLSTADIPDAATRVENTERMKKLGSSIRRVVTVPVGDTFRLNLVRTIMRSLSVLQGSSKIQMVSSTLEDGLERFIEAASPETPLKSQLVDDLAALYRALEEEAPRIERAPVFARVQRGPSGSCHRASGPTSRRRRDFIAWMSAGPGYSYRRHGGRAAQDRGARRCAGA